MTSTTGHAAHPQAQPSSVTSWALLEAWPEPACAIDGQLRAAHVNGALRRRLNAGGRTLRQWLLELDLDGVIESVLSGSTREEPYIRYTSAGDRWQVHLFPFDGHVIVKFAPAAPAAGPDAREAGLVELMTVLASATDPQQAATDAVRLLVASTSARRGALFLLDDENRHLELVAAQGYERELVSHLGRLSLPAALPDVQRLSAGEALYVDGRALRRLLRLLRLPNAPIRALALLPLLSDKQVIGVLSLSYDTAGKLEQTDRTFLEAAAHRVAQPIARVRLLRALTHEHERLKCLTDAVSQAVWWTDERGLATSSSGWSKLTGQTAEQLSGVGWLDSVHPDDRAATLEAWHIMHTAGQRYEFRHRVRRHDGEYRVMDMAAVPVRRADGTIVQWVGRHVDVTDRVHAERQMRELSVHLERQVQDRTQELQHALRQLQIETDALKAFARLTELSIHERDLIGVARHALDVLHRALPCAGAAFLERRGDLWVLAAEAGDLAPATTARYRQGLPVRSPALAAVVESRGTLFFDQWPPQDAPDADPEYACAAMAAIFSGPHAVGFVGVGLRTGEWTERSRAITRAVVDALKLTAQRLDQDRQLLEKRARLEVLNEELDAFALSVSHDLRTPVRHVRGFVDLMERAALNGDVEAVTRNATVIRSAADAMNGMIDDLLAFARQAQAPMRHASVDLGALVRDVQRSLQPDVAGRTVRWEVQSLPNVRGDVNLLRVVIMNLLSNAVKYTRTRDVARIEINARTEGGEHVLSVHDNGVGFDPRYAWRLFRPFQRLHRDEEFEGTGVGLTSAARIVRRHGGSITADGRPGGGATFTVRLPE